MALFRFIPFLVFLILVVLFVKWLIRRIRNTRLVGQVRPLEQSKDEPLSSSAPLNEASTENSSPVGSGWRPTAAAQGPPRGPSGPQGSARVQSGAAIPASRPGFIRGEVRGFQSRTETANNMGGRQGISTSEIVWTFRIERYDAGNRLSPIPIEMRGVSFTGFVSDGDMVEVRIGGWREGTTLQPDKLLNLSTHAEVQVKGSGFPKPFMVLALIGFLLIPVGVAAAALSKNQSLLVISAIGFGSVFVFGILGAIVGALRSR